MYLALQRKNDSIGLIDLNPISAVLKPVWHGSFTVPTLTPPDEHCQPFCRKSYSLVKNREVEAVLEESLKNTPTLNCHGE
jgi:hypothetical protein